ncbi:hypothetical protein B0H34DRAFT_681916 [Crassisporium funariophilum]|nr:hypothetical protein B0H34DRAFT_681916 [Crassisporium funariophilum]
MALKNPATDNGSNFSVYSMSPCENKTGTPTRSLIISPNLDALLEHEERTRVQYASATEPTTPESCRQPFLPQSTSPSAEFPIGLPPPPRNSRGPKLPRSPTGTLLPPTPASPAQSRSSSTSNPYINPAPTLAEVLQANIPSKLSVTPQPTITTVNDLSRIYDNEYELYKHSRSRSLSDTLPARSRDGSPIKAPPWSPMAIDGRNFGDQHATQQSRSKNPSLQGVDTTLSTSKNPCSSNQADAATQNSEDCQGLTRDSGSFFSVVSRSGAASSLLIRARSRGKLVKQKENMKEADMRQTSTLTVQGRENVVGPDTNNAWRRRPLISHGQRSSISSSDSTHTYSTHSPPSTTEHGPRISISSTIYPASSTQSHSQLYNDPVSDSIQRASFMEIYSPANPDFTFESNSVDSHRHGPISPLQFSKSPISQYPSPRSSPRNSLDIGRSHSPKPPIPTTPKPVFTRTNMKSGFPRNLSPKGLPSPPIASDYPQSKPAPLPPTTNFLDIDERADLIRKSRKLARVFGQTPGADAMAQQDSGRSVQSAFLLLKPRHRAALSAANDLDTPTLPQRPHSGWRSPLDSPHLIGTRRHSMPLSPDDFSFLSIASPALEGHPDASPTSTDFHILIGPQGESISNDYSANHAKVQIRSGSPTSFIDLSEDGLDGGVTNYIKRGRPKSMLPLPSSPSQSLFENMSTEEQVDEERRRKRERLAKLHRFLGSRVPASLVLGIDDVEASLPPPTLAKGASFESEDSRKAWLKRRRSSSAAISPTSWTYEHERVKEDLDDREKAINVRRAQKMEKVFGVAPPQTLYHTRHIPPPCIPLPKSSAPSPVAANFMPAMDVSPLPAQRNPNQSSYVKPKAKKTNRPGTSESNKQLLPKGPGSFGFDDRTTDPVETRHSLIYTHYQHSLNSLNDIIDRDDKESLVELHQYLNTTDSPSPKLEEFSKAAGDRRMSNASSNKSERRRSLPTRTSMMSLASEYSITTPKADVTSFQMRRRRAAKLTQFFGVDYRELINDVIDSIETGVEIEQQRGTLRAAEVEDLLGKLRNLKTKRQSFL